MLGKGGNQGPVETPAEAPKGEPCYATSPGASEIYGLPVDPKTKLLTIGGNARSGGFAKAMPAVPRGFLKRALMGVPFRRTVTQIGDWRGIVLLIGACLFLAGCKDGPGVKVGGCYKDKDGREYCVDVELTPAADGSVPALPAGLELVPEGSEKK